MPCDSRVSEPGGGDLWGLLAERLECNRERPLSIATLRTFFDGQVRPLPVIPISQHLLIQRTVVRMDRMTRCSRPSRRSGDRFCIGLVHQAAPF